MPRKYPFTRTIFAQNVTCLIFDKETAEPSNTTITITPPINDKAKLEKAAAARINTDNIKFIEIVDIENIEQLYGVTADDFMKVAVKLDPKTRKPLAE